MFLAAFFAQFGAALALELTGARSGWTTGCMITGLASLLLWTAFPGWPPRRGWR